MEATGAGAALHAIEDAGGTVDLALSNRVKAAVPAEALDELAIAEGVTRVREPNPIRLHNTSEGVDDAQAAAWHTPGAITGIGTTIAIIDGGFAGYDDRLGSELPATVQTDFSRCAAPTDVEHGTAVSEIAHDMAPGAELRLVCIEDDVDFVDAVGTLAANGVDIVNGSFGFLLSSRGDGSGGPDTIPGAVATLRDQRILYTASAGNYGDLHYNVKATGDPTPALSFANPGDSFEDFVDISSGDAFTVTVPPGGVAFVGLQWDAWPTTRQDFDMYIGNDECGLVGFMLGVVAVSPTAAGWLTVYPGTAVLPGTSNLNFAKGTNVANAVVARLGADGTVAINNARGTTHVVSDLAGYFIDPANVPAPVG